MAWLKRLMGLKEPPPSTDQSGVDAMAEHLLASLLGMA